MQKFKIPEKNTAKVIIILSIALFCMATVYFFKQAVPKRTLPILGEIQDFMLVNSEARPYGLQDLKGKVWVADFIFTTCGSVCPIMSKHMASLHRSYRLEKNTAFVSISVNPENDTPEVLREYAKRYKADTEHWQFLTGAREKIKELAVKSFKVGSADEPVFHSTYFILVDKKGQVRGYYDGTKKDPVRQLFKDISVVLREQLS